MRRERVEEMNNVTQVVRARFQYTRGKCARARTFNFYTRLVFTKTKNKNYLNYVTNIGPHIY